jgi:hypothetical protein
MIQLQSSITFCQGQPRGSPNKPGKTHFFQNNKTQTNLKTVNYTSHSHGLVPGGAHGLGNLSGPSSGRPWHPSGKSPPRSKDPASYHQISASLEGRTPPRADLRLARGLSALSNGSPPCSRPSRACGPRAHSPNQSIKCSDTTRVHRSKENPRHIGALTLPRNRIPALFRQPALCGHPQHCAGAVRQGWCQLRDTVPPTPVRPPRRTPQGRVAEPSKEVRMPTPRSRRTMS